MSQSREQGDCGRSATAEEAGRDAAGVPEEAARKRAAVETYARHEETLRRQAQRFSLCADDADEALQRGLEILLHKAPTTDPRELIRWTQTVVKHEALAVRRERERLLGGPPSAGGESGVDWIALIPAESAGPAERAERREAIARSREALQALKPQELRALGLLAEGYSYKEIGEITGFSQTKINRCLAEGRERFRSLVARSEDGRRCTELRPGLSAFCDGEAGGAEEAELREHLRACPHCRAVLRAYRAVPAAAAALAPTLPLHRSLFERAHEAAVGLASRFGGGGDSAISGVAATGGSRGAGMAALAKVLAVCAGTVGGAAACAATGVIPAPAALGPAGERTGIEREAEPESEPPTAVESPVEYEPEAPPPEQPASAPGEGRAKQSPEPQPQPEPEPPPAPAASSGAVEYSPPPPAPAPEAAAAAPSSASASSGGDASGEFGP